MWRLSESPEKGNAKEATLLDFWLVLSFLSMCVSFLVAISAPSLRLSWSFPCPFTCSFLVLALLVVAVFLMMIEQRANLVASTLGLLGNANANF